MAIAAGGSLKNYFQEELRSLREDATVFARDYPAVARELGMGHGRSRDPHVELLLQSFAYLTGRLQYRIDEERASLPNALLSHLYPHLQASIPSTAVAQLEVNAEGANFVGGWKLSRGRQTSAEAQDSEGRRLACRFTTCYDTLLWPLEIEGFGLLRADRAGLEEHSGILSVLRVQLKATGHDPIQTLDPRSLRFHIDAGDPAAYALYNLLNAHLRGIAVRVPPPAEEAAGHEERRCRAGTATLRWLGFEEDEAALAADNATHPGYRLLQEYFAFREKFLFFDVDGIDARGAVDRLELLFLFDAPAPKGLKPSPDLLRLNCVPLINLFPQPLTPVALDQRSHEYRLSGDAVHHRYCEVYRIESLTAIRPDAPVREVAPYFSMDDHDALESQEFFYIARRAESQVRSVPGTETWISFQDQRLDPDRPPADAVGGRALCTNRRLPELLTAGDALTLEGPGPVDAVRLLGKPAAHKSPHLLGEEPWALLSQLGLNHLGLSGRPGALDAFKRMLTLHADPMDAANLREIDGIRRLESRPVTRRLDGAFYHGTEVTLEVDREAFAGGSALLFAEVLRRFLALSASLDSFVQVVLESNQNKGRWKSWNPMMGGQDSPELTEIARQWLPTVGVRPVL